MIFQSATPYDGAEGEIGAVKELSGGERVVVSFSDVSEGLFTFKGRSTIDWLRADGTKARSFTAVGDDRNYYGPDCIFCSSPDDRPGYHLNNVFIESDGDIFAGGTFSIMARWGSDSALWERVSFCGKVDPTKVNQ